MKPSQVSFMCLLGALFFYSKFVSSSSSSPLTFLPGRRFAMRELLVSPSNQQVDYQKIKVTGMRFSRKGGPKATEYSRGGEDQDSKDSEEKLLVYHIDYHGVTTHPTPTPKHPKP